MTKTEFLDLSERLFVLHELAPEISTEKKEVYYALTTYFLEQNENMNLTAIRDEEAFLVKHLIDSLFVAPLIPQGSLVLDVGSGGGMPALPLAIARPDLMITALDATAKKTTFIAAAARHLGLSNVKTLTGRAEELGQNLLYREHYDIVCARAVAELRVLMEWCVPFTKRNGLFVSMKGKNAITELKSAETAARLLSCTLLSDEKRLLNEAQPDTTATGERHLLVFRKTSSTPKEYPRRNAVIQKSPL